MLKNQSYLAIDQAASIDEIFEKQRTRRQHAMPEFRGRVLNQTVYDALLEQPKTKHLYKLRKLEWEKSRNFCSFLF